MPTSPHGRVSIAMTTDDPRHPSTVTDDYWVRAHAPDSHSLTKEAIDFVGKWLVFVYMQDLDTTWAAIREATASGKLGIEAKAATARENPLGTKPGVKLICVYTRDCRDLDDVRRVLAGLRELGITYRLNYKTDDATYAGEYGAGVSLYTSDPDSEEFHVPKSRRKR